MDGESTRHDNIMANLAYKAGHIDCAVHLWPLLQCRQRRHYCHIRMCQQQCRCQAVIRSCTVASLVEAVRHGNLECRYDHLPPPRWCRQWSHPRLKRKQRSVDSASTHHDTITCPCRLSGPRHLCCVMMNLPVSVGVTVDSDDFSS